jgi:thiol-disulfide isomerase/thioredoxin
MALAWLGNPWARAGLVAAAVAIAWPAAYFSRARSVDPNAEQARLDFVLKDMNGRDVRLADFKGRPLVVNFWATDCPPCRHEIPYFVELVERYKREQLAVLGISISDKPEELRPFADKFSMNYPVLVGLGQDELLQAYEGDVVIPVTWFIRRDGTVYKKKIGSDTKEWFETQVKALF